MQQARGHHYRADSGRVRPTDTPRHGGRRTEYTIAHAGRQFRLGPVAFWIAVGTLVIMAGWSLATGSYFAFHDDVLTRLIARQKEQQFAYEDRIAELRAQVDRIASRQLLDQDQFEQKLDQVRHRQSMLESRASALAGFPDSAPTGSIKSRPMPIAEPPAGETFKASPISAPMTIIGQPDREARLNTRRTPANAAAATGVEGILARLQTSLDHVEAKQTATLNTLEERYDSKAKRMRSVLADLGVDAKKETAGAQVAGVGGPFVPVTLRKDASDFERQFYRAQIARANVDRLTRTFSAVPVRKPIMGEIDLSSGFGVRTDPFLGRPAMHTGLDFRSAMGDPVRATANGTVDIAGPTGGYGNMIEINHGNGLETRYGHLSAIEVRVGQKVQIGQVIGRVGTTGRSTGPHLHYETRIDGEAVDPQRFLRAGLRLGTL